MGKVVTTTDPKPAAQPPATPPVEGKPVVAPAATGQATGDVYVETTTATPGAPEVMPAPTAVAPAAPGTATGDGKSNIVLRLGTGVITEEQVLAAVQSMDLSDRVGGLLVQWGAKVGLAPAAGDALQSFEARLLEALAAKGEADAFLAARQGLFAEAREQAIVGLIHIDIIKRALGSERLPETKDASGLAPLVPLLEVLHKLGPGALAELMGAKPEELATPEAMRAAIEAWLGAQTIAQLWQPHRAVVDAALAGYAPADAETIRGALLDRYWAAYGTAAPARIAEEMKSGGTAAQLVALIQETRSLTWSPSQIAMAAVVRPELAPLAQLAAQARQEVDPLAGFVQVVVDRDGPRFTTGSADNPFLDDEGKSRLARFFAGKPGAWTTSAPGGQPTLTFADLLKGVPAEDAEAMRAVADLVGQGLLRLPAALEAAWQRGTPPWSELVARAGLAGYLDAQAVAKLGLTSPDMVTVLRRLVAREAALGKSSDEIRAKAKTLGLPDGLFGEDLVKLGDAVRSVSRSLPLPEAFRKYLAQPQTPAMRIPIKIGARLTPEQSAVVATLQRYRLAMDPGWKGATTGLIDAHTKALLSEWNPGGKDAAEFALDGLLVAETLASVAELPQVAPREGFLGEYLLVHPVVAEMKRQGLKGDPVRAVLWYLKETQNGAVSIQGGPPGAPLSSHGAFDPAAASIEVGQPLLDALWHSRSQKLDAGALRRAALRAAEGAPWGQAALESLLTTRVAERPGVLVVPGKTSAEDKERALARLATLAEPIFVSTVPRSEFGMLPLYEPIAALRLVAASQRGLPPPISADGVLRAALPSEDLEALRDMRWWQLEEGKPKPPAYAAWQRVIGYVKDGKLAIGDLTDDVKIPGQPQMETDINLVLSDLRQLVQGIRMSTSPTDAAQSAAMDQRRPYDPVVFFPRPLLKAAEVIAGKLGGPKPKDDATVSLSARDFEQVERIIAEVVERYGADASKVLAQDGADYDYIRASAGQLLKMFQAVPKGRSAALLNEVKGELASGRLTLAEGLVRGNPRDALREARGEWASQLYVLAAEYVQAERRQANHEKLSSKSHRVAVELANHFSRLPGFADVVSFNQVDDWRIIRLKSEMVSRGLIKDVSVRLPDKTRAALATPDQADATLDALYNDPAFIRQRAPILHIDAAFLRYLASEYSGVIGASKGQVAYSGLPETIPEHDEARALLIGIAKRMEAGELDAWTTLNVNADVAEGKPGDSAKEREKRGAELRTAKAIVQTALRRMESQGGLLDGVMAGRDVFASREVVNRLLGMDAIELAPHLKGFLVAQGLATLADVGRLNDPHFPPELVHLLLSVSQRVAKTDDTSAEAHAIRQATAVLRKAVVEKRTVALEGHSPEAKALRKLFAEVVSRVGSVNSVGSFDFGQIAGHLADRGLTAADYARDPFDLISLGVKSGLSLLGLTDRPNLSGVRIEHPKGNLVNLDSAPLDVTRLPENLGNEMPLTEDMAERMSRWSDRVNFAGALDSAWGSFVLFTYLMPTMIAYDFVVSPSKKSWDAATQWRHAQTDDERRQALDNLGDAWKNVGNLWVMLTAFRWPGGFAEDIKDQLEQGNLGIAAGKGVVYYQFLKQTTRATVGMGRGAWHLGQRLVLGKPPLVLAQSGYDAVLFDAERASAQPAGGRPAGGGRTAALAGQQARRALSLTTEALLEPKHAVSDAWGETWSGVKRGFKHVFKLENGKVQVREGGPAGFAGEINEAMKAQFARTPGAHYRATLVRGWRQIELNIPREAIIALDRTGQLDARYLKNVPRGERVAVANSLKQMWQGVAQVDVATSAVADAVESVSKVPSLSEIWSQPATRFAYSVNGKSYGIKGQYVADFVRATHIPSRTLTLARAAHAAGVPVEVAESIASRYQVRRGQARWWTSGTGDAGRTLDYLKERFSLGARVPAGAPGTSRAVTSALSRMDPKTFVEVFNSNPELTLQLREQLGSRAATVEGFVRRNWHKLHKLPEVQQFLRANKVAPSAGEAFLQQSILNGSAFKVVAVVAVLGTHGLFEAVGIEDKPFLEMGVAVGSTLAANAGLRAWAKSANPSLFAGESGATGSRLAGLGRQARGFKRGFVAGWVADRIFRMGTEATEKGLGVRIDTSGTPYRLTHLGVTAGAAIYADDVLLRLGSLTHGAAARLGVTATGLKVVGTGGKILSKALGAVSAPLLADDILSAFMPDFKNDYQNFEARLGVQLRSNYIEQAMQSGVARAAMTTPIWAMDKLELYIEWADGKLGGDGESAVRLKGMHQDVYDFAHLNASTMAESANAALETYLGSQLMALATQPRGKEPANWLTRVDAKGVDLQGFVSLLTEAARSAAKDGEIAYRDLAAQQHTLAVEQAFPYTMRFHDLIGPDGVPKAAPEKLLAAVLASELELPSPQGPVKATVEQHILRLRRQARLFELIPVAGRLASPDLPADQREQLLATVSKADRQSGLWQQAEQAAPQWPRFAAALASVEQAILHGAGLAEGESGVAGQKLGFDPRKVGQELNEALAQLARLDANPKDQAARQALAQWVTDPNQATPDDLLAAFVNRHLPKSARETLVAIYGKLAEPSPGARVELVDATRVQNTAKELLAALKAGEESRTLSVLENIPTPAELRAVEAYLNEHHHKEMGGSLDAALVRAFDHSYARASASLAWAHARAPEALLRNRVGRMLAQKDNAALLQNVQRREIEAATPEQRAALVKSLIVGWHCDDAEERKVLQILEIAAGDAASVARTVRTLGDEQLSGLLKALDGAAYERLLALLPKLAGDVEAATLLIVAVAKEGTTGRQANAIRAIAAVAAQRSDFAEVQRRVRGHLPGNPALPQLLGRAQPRV